MAAAADPGETHPFSPHVHSSIRTKVRWKVLAVTVALAFITYLDRVCISTTAPKIMHDLHLSTVQMSFVFSAFTTAYAIFEIPTGWWGDRVGTRRVLTRIVLWWSSFTALTAGAWNFPSMLAVRALFGMGEAGAWPNVARTFSRWFPPEERGTAQGIFFAGAHFGAGVTPLLVAAIVQWLPWRAVFVLFAITGFIWSILWYVWFRDDPREHSAVNEAEAEWIARGANTTPSGHSAAVFKFALRSPSVWSLCFMYFTQSYGFYFFITWFPAYLQREKHLSGFALGLFAGAPMLMSVVADLTGGLTTDWLTRRTNLRIGRCLTGGASLVLAALFLTIGTLTKDALAAGLLIAVAAMWSNFLLGASWGTCLDIAGPHAGTVSATMNTAGQVGGILSPIIFALLTRNATTWEAPLFLIAGLYFFGGLCWWFVHPERPLYAS
jgi:ACS family glucarate transporter-like MFS transporter